MKEILNGLAVIGGIIVIIYALIWICGITVIFVHNLFRNVFNTYKLDYDWYTIRHNGLGAIITIIIICFILFIAYMFGSAITI